MLTRAKAMAKADALLRAEGSPDVAVTATPNPSQSLWIVGRRNSQRPDDLIVGGGPLVVPTSGPAYEANGSIPPWPEDVGMEEPESWRFEHGEELLPEDWRQRLEGELEQVTGTSCFRSWRRSARRTTSSRRRPRLSLPSS